MAIMLSSWKHVRIRKEFSERVAHLLLFVTAEDPTTVESLLPVFARVVIQGVFLATVDAACIVRTVLSLWGGGDGRVVLRLATAARCEGAMEGKGVGFSAQRAELHLERADVGITFMPELPAAIALGNASTTFGRSKDETMTAVHERVADEVSKVETRTGVCNVKPDRAGVGVTCILGEACQRVLIITEVLDKRGDVEDLGYLFHREGDQLARLLVTFRRQTIIRKVTYLEAGLRGQDFDPEIHLGSLLFEFRLEHDGEDFKVILVRDIGSSKGQTSPAGLHRCHTNRTLGVSQTTVDLVVDNILRPLEGGRGEDGDLLARTAKGGGFPNLELSFVIGTSK